MALVVQVVSGAGMMGGGGAAAAGGVVAAPVTGGGSLVISGGGAAVVAGGAVVATQGATNVVAGILTLTNAMAISTASGAVGGGPTGTPTKIPPNEKDPENIRALTRENESAQLLSKKGYKVEQNPAAPPGSKKNPDYEIEGKYFDNVAPASNTSVRNIHSRVADKVTSGQTQRVVINMDDSKVSMDALRKQFKDWPVEGLEEVLVVRGREVSRLFP